jgi:hypothetical protein
MTNKPAQRAPAIQDRIHEEMLDSFDEELELEIDDDRLDALTNEFSGHTAGRSSTGASTSRNCSACKASW